jgi:hypothetical protein
LTGCGNRSRAGQKFPAVFVDDLADDFRRVRDGHGDFNDGKAAGTNGFSGKAGHLHGVRAHHRNDADLTDSSNHFLDSHFFSCNKKGALPR